MFVNGAEEFHRGGRLFLLVIEIISFFWFFVDRGPYFGADRKGNRGCENKAIREAESQSHLESSRCFGPAPVPRGHVIGS